MNVKQRKICASLIVHAIQNVHKDVLAMVGVKIPLLQSNIRFENFLDIIINIRHVILFNIIQNNALYNILNNLIFI